MNNTVVLHNLEIELDSSAGRAFTIDCVRAAEGLCSDDDIKTKYEISAEDWEGITTNKALIRAIQAARERRVRNGEAARESAAKIFAKAPEVLGDILNDNSASARHRIESARELRQTALGSADAESTADAGEKFIITINLGADHVEHYEKTIAPMKPLLPANEDKVDDDAQ
jgi:hypothetical protein